MRSLLRFLIILGTLVHGNVLAQSAAILADGKAFAESIAPQSAGQIVNPAGVNASSWSFGSTTIPTAVPSGMGSFSNPTTSSPLFDTSGAQGALAALGTGRIAHCRNYVPSGDPIADQECAAVRFLNKDCLPITTAQTQVLGSAGTGQSPGADCVDTYGSGASNFGYQNVITAQDPMFHLTQTAQNNAPNVSTEECVSTPIVVQPAEYEINTCAKSTLTNEHICTQELAVAITTTYSDPTATPTCPGGTLVNGSCVGTDSNPATPTYTCPVGTLSGTLCLDEEYSPATPTLTCPNGATLSGDTCTGTTSVPATTQYVCPPLWDLNTDHCTQTYPGTITLRCWKGLLDDGMCVWNSGNQEPGASCVWLGTIVQYMCSAPAAQEVSCPDGGTAEGSSCVRSSTATINYVCGEGVLSGTNCIIDANGPAIPGYACETGVLTGTQCVVTTSHPADVDYYCPDGATLNGTMCNTTSTWDPTVVYTCPSGRPPVNGMCKLVLTQTNWIDNCDPYEASAGISLGGP